MLEENVESVAHFQEENLVEIKSFHNQAEILTKDASRYITRLCKHFAHKVKAVWTEDTGKVDFFVGECEMMAKEDRLILECHSDNLQDLADIQETLDSHIERFFLKDSPVIKWQN